MRKEIWKILKDLETEKTTTNEAYHSLCDLYNVMQAKPEKVCEGCKKPLETGLCGSCCSDLASGNY